MKGSSLLAILLLMVLILSGMPAGSSDISLETRATGGMFGYRVVFDRSYGQIYSIYDTGFCGYSTLATLMEDKGFTVFESLSPLSETIENMTCRDILFLGVAKNEEYSDKDVASILSFIAGGGRAIIIGEHTNTYGMGAFQNKLAMHFGVKFGYGDIIEKDPKRGIAGPERLGVYEDGYIWFLARGSGPLSGIDEVPVYDAAPLEISSDNVTPILKASEVVGSDNVVAALADYGMGKVVFIGDSEIFWNGDGNISINYKNGTEFAEAILDLLVPPHARIESEYDLLTSNAFSIEVDAGGNFTSIWVNATGVTVDTSVITSPGEYTIHGDVEEDGHIDFIEDNFIIKRIYVLKPKYPSKPLFRTLIDESGHARGITENPDSLLNLAIVLRDSGSDVFASSAPKEYDFDSYVVVNPLETTDHPWINQKNIRILVAGDMYTTLLDSYPWDVLKRNSYHDRESPANALSERFGISFSGYLATCGSKYDNPFFLRATHTFGFSFPAYDAVTLSFGGGHILAQGESDSWGELYDFFGSTIVKDASDSSDVYLMGYNDNGMVLGCGESLTDRFSSDAGWKTLVESIADWLDFRYVRKDGEVEIMTTDRAKKAFYTISGIEHGMNLSSGHFNISLGENEASDILIKIFYEYGDGHEGFYINEVQSVETSQNQYPLTYIVLISAALAISFIVIYIKFFRKKR